MNIKEFIKHNILGVQYEYEAHFETVIRLLNKNLTAYHPRNLLDVGCGIGDRAVRVAQHMHIDQHKIYGLDCNEQQINECRKLFNAELIDLESKKLPYPDNTFDLVICNQVLEHLVHYREVLDDIIRVTAQNGYIVLGVPNLSHLINRIYLLFGIQPMCIHPGSVHLRAFTHRLFVEMLNAVPSVRLISFTGSVMYPLPYYIAKYASRICVGFSGYICYLLKKENAAPLLSCGSKRGVNEE